MIEKALALFERLVLAVEALGSPQKAVLSASNPTGLVIPPPILAPEFKPAGMSVPPPVPAPGYVPPPPPVNTETPVPPAETAPAGAPMSPWDSLDLDGLKRACVDRGIQVPHGSKKVTYIRMLNAWEANRKAIANTTAPGPAVPPPMAPAPAPSIVPPPAPGIIPPPLENTPQRQEITTDMIKDQARELMGITRQKFQGRHTLPAAIQERLATLPDQEVEIKVGMQAAADIIYNVCPASNGQLANVPQEFYPALYRAFVMEIAQKKVC